MNKTALITGITGQDGSYLAELLLSKNYKVVGLYRRSSINSFSRIDSTMLSNPNLIMEEFDLTDPSDCSSIVERYQPDEVYNLAAQSHVATSFKQPTTTVEINTIGVLNLLEAIRSRCTKSRFYQASTSEMFGSNYVESVDLGKYQNEETPFVPQSPYAIAKLASHHMVRVYRDAYKLYACSGILFNHESPRRGENFVTRKITKYIGGVANKRIDGSVVKLKLGNLDATRDWGHAKDYVYGMYLMLQQDQPKDYVLATGESHTVKEFLELAFNSVDLDYRDYVVVDPEFYRPCEVPFLRGDSTLARKELGWDNKVSFQQLVSEMVQNDVA
jgi:GDPmannose 4,6-dehydratase